MVRTNFEKRSKTKIVATVGPASESKEILRRMALAGVSVFRLNFAHGDWAWHDTVFQRIRAVSEELQVPLAILQDLGGPKLRLGELPGDKLACALGDTLRMVREPTGAEKELTCSYAKLVDDLRPDDQLLFADGSVGMKVTRIGPGWAELEVTLPGEIGSRQGINAPNARLQLESLTEKDLHDLDWAAAHDVDFIGMSFVRRAEDIDLLRSEMKKRNIKSQIIAKIEKAEALAALPAIIRQTDAVMVARGDLGVEIDVARVPVEQKRIIDRCRQLGVPVITATQMLESMRTSNRPTRAEASDVANAILDGTDAVMLSGETASGTYPVEAVTTMNRIARETEKSMTPGKPLPMAAFHSSQLPDIVQAMVNAARLLAEQVEAKLVVVATRSGMTALAMAKSRSLSMTLGLSDNMATVRRLCLYWGVLPVYFKLAQPPSDYINRVCQWVVEQELASSGDRLVFLVGASWTDAGFNTVMVHEVP
jgi:pyruvate kinase